VVSREVAGDDTAVVTVGALRAGTKENIIPDDAELLLSVRTVDPAVRRRVLDAIGRIVRAEAAASGAPRDPVIETTHSFGAVVNDEEAAEHTSAAFAGRFGADRVFDPGPVTGSEDVGLFATAAEDERIAALQAHDALAASRRLDHEALDALLRDGAASRALSRLPVAFARVTILATTSVYRGHFRMIRT